MAGLALMLVSIGASAGAQPLWTERAPEHLRQAETLPDFVALAARLSPAVVNISSEQKASAGDSGAGPESDPESNRDPFDRFGRPFEHYDLSHPHSLGSGFIINPAGYILTNDHVVEDSGRTVVTLRDGHEYAARVIGRDSRSDIALIKIDAPHELPVAPLGDSDSVRVGEWVIAIGNPFGFDHSVTAGIVSAKGRFIPGNFDDYIQTDASINPGNSGGPLIDLRGDVVGVNSAIYTRTGASMGIGFAIPVNLVKQELPELRSHGKIVRGWLGVYIQPVSETEARAAGLSEPHGALISEVLDHSPAETAGLKHGDIVVAFDDREIGASQELPLMVGAVPIGHGATLTIIRGRAAHRVPITIGAARREQLAKTEVEAPAGGDPGSLGMALKDLNPALARTLNIPDASGVVIEGVEAGSRAAAAGLRARDVILEVNQRPVKSVDAFAAAVDAGDPDHVVLLLIRRDKGTLFIPLRRQG
jgi:serine protease Do